MGANDSRLTADNYRTPSLLNSLSGRLAEFVGFHRQLFSEFSAPKNLQPIEPSIDETFFPQELLSNLNTFVELFEVTEVHQRISGFELRVVKSSLWQTPDQRHLAAFKS
jgi:hypothetical protein